MRNDHPSNLALALLDRFVSDDVLTGDLIEEFQVRRSRLWLWRQVLGAIVFAPFRRPREVRPLVLVDGRATTIVSSRRPAARRPPINLTASPLPGVGGLTLVVLLLVLTAVAPQIWWVAVAAAGGGVLLGVVRIVLHRSRGPGAS